jgi:tRNA (adenine37-N6)-methyltransferase
MLKITDGAALMSINLPSQDDDYSKKICFEPIAWVKNGFNERSAPDSIRSEPSKIIVREDLVLGLQGLEVGSEILILFYMDRSKEYQLLQYPRGDQTRPIRGVFSLRSPNRPNRIGATVVTILAIENNELTVKGLDALNNSAVIDIKPA